MNKFQGLEHSQELFQKERTLAEKNNIAVVWVGADNNRCRVFQEIAAALPDIKVRPYTLLTEHGPRLGAKIVNLKSGDLSTFWEIAHEVYIDVRSPSLRSSVIKQEVSRVMKDYHSGELRKRKERESDALFWRALSRLE